MTCEKVLQQYLDSNLGFHRKVNLYAIAEDWSPETVGRALRTLHEQGKIKVNYYDGKYAKHLAMYASNLTEAPKKMKVVMVDGIPKAVYN